MSYIPNKKSLRLVAMTVPDTKWKPPWQRVEAVVDQASLESGCNSAGEFQHTERD